MLYFSSTHIRHCQIARAAGSVKADQWKPHSAIFFVALFVAWEDDGEIPDIDALSPGRGTKIEAAMLSQQKLVHQRLRAHMLAQNPDTPPDDLPTFRRCQDGSLTAAPL